MFTVTGTMLNEQRTVVWENGHLSGDRFAVNLIRNTALARNGHPVGPVGGPYTIRDHLTSPVSVAILIKELFERIHVWEGELPGRSVTTDDVV